MPKKNLNAISILNKDKQKNMDHPRSFISFNHIYDQ